MTDPHPPPSLPPGAAGMGPPPALPQDAFCFSLAGNTLVEVGTTISPPVFESSDEDEQTTLPHTSVHEECKTDANEAAVEVSADATAAAATAAAEAPRPRRKTRTSTRFSVELDLDDSVKKRGGAAHPEVSSPTQPVVPPQSLGNVAATTTGAMTTDIVWHTEHWMNCYANYSELVSLLSCNLSAVKKIGELLDPAEFDSFAKVAVTILHKSGRVLPLLSTLVRDELQIATSAGKFSIFRGNNMASAIEKAYVKLVGKEYLWSTVGDTVRTILSDMDLDLEIDPTKLDGLFEDKAEMDRMIGLRVKAIESFVTLLIVHIVDASSTDKMPNELRTLVSIIASNAKEFIPEMLLQLIDGFLILRVFSPAIVAPESAGIVPAEMPPSPRGRRNLILVAKVLQSIANIGAAIGKKEDYMEVFVDYIAQQVPVMTDYFTRLAQPYKNIDPHVELVAAQRDKLPDPHIDVRDFALADLFEMHRVLYCAAGKLVPALQAAPYDPSSWQTALLALIARLGPPPGFTALKAPLDVDVSSLTGFSGTTTASTPAQTQMDSDQKVLETSRFLYQGPSTPKGEAVFYLIMSRVDTAFLQNINPLIAHVYKVMDAAVQAGPYILIVDMSWVSLSTATKRLIYDRMHSLWKLFSRAYKKNIRKIFILQPDTFIQMCLFVLKAFVSRKLFSKVFELYDWKQLPPQLGLSPENVMLPDTAKHAVSKVYKVVKINSHGKRQDRLVKFTLDSLLNLDSRATKILNEKLLSIIEEISIKGPRSLEIYMRFQQPQSGKQKYKLFAGTQELDERTYVCQSLTERDGILQDIFAGGFRCGHTPGRQEYNVVKVNGAGKHQDRVFKLTVDSLMNVSGSDIRHEMCFAGIDEVKPDTATNGVVWLKYKSETQWRKIILNPNDAPVFVQNLLEGMKLYSANSTELDPFQDAQAAQPTV